MRLLFLVLLSHFTLHAQNIEFNGKTVNNKTKEGISYSTVLIPSLKIGTISNEYGHFTLMTPDTHQNDTIVISALGFERKEITIHEIQKANKGIIELSEKVYLLEEVSISPGKAEVLNIGFKGNKAQGPFLSNIFGSIIGLHIENNTDKVGILKKLGIYICNEGKPDTPFRVRIFSVNPENKQPDLDLLLENVIVSGKRNGGWLYVDLKKYNITFPQEGFFVMAEDIYFGDQYYYTKDILTKEKDGKKFRKETRTYYGIVLGCSKHMTDKKLTWGRRSIGQPWVVHDQTRKGKYFNIMINADIEFVK
jgi:hypothetical protein